MSDLSFKRLARLAEGVRRREPKLVVRPIRMDRFDEDLAIVKTIYNGAWEKNWGFVPMTSDEIDAMAKKLKPILYPPYILFAEIDGKPAAFHLALPDFNQVLVKMGGSLFPFGWLKFLTERKKIDRCRTMALGVLPEYRKRGLDAVLYYEAMKEGIRIGHKWAEFSWMLEDNLDILKPLEVFGGRDLPPLPARGEAPVERVPERHRHEREGEARDHVRDVVVPAVDRGQDEADRERQEHPERLFRPAIRLEDDRDEDHRVAGREAVALVLLEDVERVVDRLRDRASRQRPGVRQRVARADRGHEEVARVADVEDEHDDERVTGEVARRRGAGAVVEEHERPEDDRDGNSRARRRSSGRPRGRASRTSRAPPWGPFRTARGRTR